MKKLLRIKAKELLCTTQINAKGFAHHLIVIGLIVVIVIGGTGAYVYKKSKAATSSYACPGNVHRTLKPGATNLNNEACVSHHHRMLKRTMCPNGAYLSKHCTNFYGSSSNTYNIFAVAVTQDFQRIKRLTANGIVESRTWNALHTECEAKTTSSPDYRNAWCGHN